MIALGMMLLEEVKSTVFRWTIWNGHRGVEVVDVLLRFQGVPKTT